MIKKIHIYSILKSSYVNKKKLFGWQFEKQFQKYRIKKIYSFGREGQPYKCIFNKHFTAVWCGTVIYISLLDFS